MDDMTEEIIKAHLAKMANSATSVWTTTPPKESSKSLLEMIRAAKDKLVLSQRYDDAKDLRDIERMLMEKMGNQPVVLNDIEAMLDSVREAKNASARAEEGTALVESRIEKMEKALSEEMAKTREMDDILSGVVKKVGYMSEGPKDDLIERWCIGDPRNPIARWQFNLGVSPSGIPFSVALEYLKAGREIRRPHWGTPSRRRVQAQGVGGAGGLWVITGASYNEGLFQPDTADMIATDWVVLPETQNP